MMCCGVCCAAQCAGAGGAGLADHWNLMFVRHRSGPLYYMYIGSHAHFLRKGRDGFAQPGMDVHDIIVDDHARSSGACARTSA